jgi:outer membrane lipoprotein-sorting protein
VTKSLGRRLLRFGLPGAAVAFAVVAAAVTPSLSSAQDPLLQPLTPSQLVAAVLGAKPVSFEGTLTATSNLFGSDASLISASGQQLALPQGSESIRIFSARKALRLEMLSSQAERDLYVSNNTAWLWNSATNTATEITGGMVNKPARDVAVQMDPTLLAERIISRWSQYSQISLGTNTFVAGQPAYDLVVVPNQNGTTISSVNIYIDASNYAVLEIQVNSVYSGSPVLSAQFQNIQFTNPPSSDFAFSPPVGATVQKSSLQSMIPSVKFESGTTIGSGWDTVYVIPASQGNQVTNKLSSALSRSSVSKLLQTATYGNQRYRVLHTNLVNALFAPNGEIFAGPVRTSVLEADAAALQTSG